jgi:hypothetical protein
VVQEYYEVDGKPPGEVTAKWLQDDHVKFLRFGQWRIEKTGQGMPGMTASHGCLGGPTFRGMRLQLMNAFDEIYVLDPQGNARKSIKVCQEPFFERIGLNEGPAEAMIGKGQPAGDAGASWHAGSFHIRGASGERDSGTDLIWKGARNAEEGYVGHRGDGRARRSCESCRPGKTHGQTKPRPALAGQDRHILHGTRTDTENRSREENLGRP